MKIHGKTLPDTLVADGIALISPYKRRNRPPKLHAGQLTELGWYRTLCGKSYFIPDIYEFWEVPIAERCNRCHQFYLTLHIA